MKKILFAAIAVWSTSYAQAQTKDRQVIASGGAFVTSPTVQVSFTLGETAIQYLSASGAIASQGFQQAKNVGASIGNVKHIDAQVSTYPNPFVSFIEVKSEQLLHNATFQLIDVHGKSIPISSVVMQADKHWRIEVGEIASGNYWLSISAEGKQGNYALTQLAQ